MTYRQLWRLFRGRERAAWTKIGRVCWVLAAINTSKDAATKPQELDFWPKWMRDEMPQETPLPPLPADSQQAAAVLLEELHGQCL